MTPKVKRQPGFMAGNRRQTNAAAKSPARAWQLPSGKKLSEFALVSGFLAPRLFEPNLIAKRPKTASREGQSG